MAGIVAPETPDDPSVYAPNGYSRVDRTWMEGFHAQVTESFNTTAIGPQLWREADRQLNNTSSPLLSREQANEQYGIPDVLQFDQPINAENAAERQRLVQDQMRRQSIVDRSSVGTIGRLSASLIGGAADPMNIAFAVAPEALLARASGFGRGAALSFSERIAFGASSGALGNAVLTPAQAYFAGQEGRDYGIGEALADITLGAAIGGAAPIVGKGLSVLRSRWMRDATRVVDAIHSVGEPSSNPARLANSTADARLESLSTVLQQKLVGLPADLSAAIQTLDLNARALGEVDQAISVASIRAAQALRASVGGDLTAAATRRAGFAPFGETGSRIGDTRIIVGWQSNDYGTVAPRDLERMSPLTQTMVPVEETADSATWRVRRAADGRTVEYRVQETPEGQKWHVTIAPKKAPLSRFIDEQAPAELQTAFTQPAPDVSNFDIRTGAGAEFSSVLTDAPPPLVERTVAGEMRPTEFGQWFEGSVVKNADGTPMRVFHGTVGEFDQFDRGRLGEATQARSAKEGFFFTNNAALASDYAETFDPYDSGNIASFLNKLSHGLYAKANNAFLRATGRAPLEIQGGNVRPVYLSINNPKMFDFEGQHVSEYTERRFGDLIAQAKKDGHDGVIVKNARDPVFEGNDAAAAPSTIFVVFDPKDIRTAIGPKDVTAQAPDTVVREPSTNSPNVSVDAQLKDPDELLRSYAGKTYRAGEQMPEAYNFRYAQQPATVGDPIALQDLAAMQQIVDEAPPVPRSARDEGQVLGQGTAATRELEQFAAQDEAVLQALRDQGRLTAADEAQFEQIGELEKQYKELADARARAVTCFMMEGNG